MPGGGGSRNDYPEAKPSQQLIFTRNVLAGQGVKITQDSPLKGTVVEVMEHFPPGCNALVDVMVGRSSKQFVPQSGYIALDNATPIFRSINEPVNENESVWVEMRNRDAMNPHNITVTVTIEAA